MQTRRITFRLYPTHKQVKKLHYARKLHQLLYNAALVNRKTQYQKFNHSVNYWEQQNCLPEFKEVWPEYKQLNSMALQATLKRIDYSYSRFFSGLSGYPKLKPLRKFSGWTYPDARQGFKVHSTGKNGYLELRDLGLTIQLRGQARIWGKVTSCTIVYRQGLWFASITVNCEPTRETLTGAIGLDFGCKVAVADSNDNFISPPKFYRKQLEKIKKVSKQKRRKRAPDWKKKIKASKRWRKAQSKISKLNRKAANQRQDWQHQTAAQIVRINSLVATEKLNLKTMTGKAKVGKRKKQKAGLNKSILDVGIGGLREAIKYKLAEAGGLFVEVPTKQVKPTQRCNNCWELTPKTLSDRLHVCQHCHHIDDRDSNSAKVCLTWARGREPSSLNVERQALPKSCGGFRQLASAKRPKLPAQTSEAS